MGIHGIQTLKMVWDHEADTEESIVLLDVEQAIKIYQPDDNHISDTPAAQQATSYPILLEVAECYCQYTVFTISTYKSRTAYTNTFTQI